MKKFFILSLVLLFAVSFNSFAQKKGKTTKPAATKSAPTSTNRIYETKSGKLVYKMDLLGEQFYTLYWDNYGEKEVKHLKVEVEMFGQKSVTENFELKLDGYLYKYEKGKPEGTKTKTYSSLGGAQGMPTDISKVAKEQIESMKLKDLGTREILGKTCKGMQMEPSRMKMEVWTWGNLMLESKTWLSQDGKPIEMNAVSLDLDVEVPADLFKVPEDVKFTEY